jgi:hypothetical protein
MHYGSCTRCRISSETPGVAVAALVNQLIVRRSRLFFDLPAQHVFERALNRVFAHQLELSARVTFPNCDLGKRDGNRAIAERIVARRLHVVEIAPRYVHDRPNRAGAVTFPPRRSWDNNHNSSTKMQHKNGPWPMNMMPPSVGYDVDAPPESDWLALFAMVNFSRLRVGAANRTDMR